jgi:penicillin-binding protein 1A
MATKQNNKNVNTSIKTLYYTKTFWRIFFYGMAAVVLFFLFAHGALGACLHLRIGNPDSNLATEVTLRWSSDSKYFQKKDLS